MTLSLSDQFIGVGAKVLRGTEIDPTISNGHEFQGIDDFRAFLGSPPEKARIPVTYIWLSDLEEPLKQTSSGTWYDSRKGQPHRTAEYRLYYPHDVEDLIIKARPGDTLFLALKQDKTVLALLCASKSDIERQLLWLFRLELRADHYIVQRDLRQDQGTELGFAARYVLEEVGIEIPEPESDPLDKLLAAFGPRFPSTRAFSAFARKSLKEISAQDNPDQVLMAWLEREEALFRRLERHIVATRLKEGFVLDGDADVDGFIRFSLAVQNRRKSRAGLSLENHLEELFTAHNIAYRRGAVTENNNKPDFLFPGQLEYHDSHFPAARLTMLAAKSTCKDRWRQALSEAQRIEEKHLITLEPGISDNQTDEMRTKGLQLVVPQGLHETYREKQRIWLMDISQFVNLVATRQTG